MVNTELLLTDGDGTLSEAANPFLTVAEVLGCGKAVRELVKSYLRKEMSYDELVEVENSLFLERGRRYANRLGMPRLGQHEFRKLLPDLNIPRTTSSPARRRGHEQLGSINDFGLKAHIHIRAFQEYLRSLLAVEA